jgi:hypothetical protein
MADEVISGGQQIASEATLSALLNAVSGSSDSSAAIKVRQLATASGVAGNNVQDFGNKVLEVADAASGLTKSFLQGTATASGMFGAMGSLPGPIGLVFKGLSAIAGFQEEAMAQYQSMSKAGVSFGGALSDLRVAAAETHMTLSQFATLIKANGDTLARLGGTANDGAKAFVRLSTEIMSTDMGNKLKSLGYTAEEVNQGMLSYIQMTGGRSAEELKNTKQLTASAAEYMTQLDGLAQLTGKSREEQEKSLKEAQTNAAIQQKLAGMSEEQKAAYNRGLAEMNAKFGKAGTEMYQAQVMGIAPQTEAAKNLMVLAPEVAKASQGMADVAKNGGTAADTMKYSADATQGAVQASKRYGDALKGAMSFRTDGTAQALNALGMSAVQAEKAGRDTSEKELAARAKIATEQKERQESQAAEMVNVDQSLKQFSVTLLTAINPFIKVLTWVIDKFSFLVPVIGSVAVALAAMKVAAMVKGSISSAGGVAGSLLGGGGGVAPSGAGALAGAGGGGGGGGAGGGFVGFIRSLGRSLASLAPIAVPMLIGAGAVAGVIALLGAGVAAAVALIGLSLPIFAKGLKDIAEIDGMNLAKVALGIAALGPALVLFTGGSLIAGLGAVGSKILNFFSGGGPIEQIKSSVTELIPVLPQMQQIGPALNNYANGIVAFGKAVAGVDIAKAERLKEVMKGPGVLEGIGSAISNVGAATAKLITNQSGGQEKSSADLAALNSTMRELVRFSKEIAEYTKQTVDATKNLSGDHFK